VLPCIFTECKCCIQTFNRLTIFCTILAVHTEYNLFTILVWDWYSFYVIAKWVYFVAIIFFSATAHFGIGSLSFLKKY